MKTGHRNGPASPLTQKIPSRDAYLSNEPKVPTRTGTTSGLENVSLTVDQQKQFNHCEHILCAGLHTFFEVGSALLIIREERLYRATHETFESYCQERWEIGRSYAWRVIAAAERVKLLPADNSIPKPCNEFQMRPFLKLDPKEFPKVWQQALKKAKNGKVTRSLAQELVTGLGIGTAHGSVKLRISSGKGTFNGVQLHDLLNWLHDVKESVEEHDREAAVAALQWIEEQLTGRRQAHTQHLE